MPKVQSQWQFDDLLAQASARKVFSVAELTSSIKRLLEQHIGRVWVTGEITNLRAQSSGHIYFCIKDASAQLNCVLFRAEARALNRDLLDDGLRVNVGGELTVYEARGQYQLIVTAVELQGVGALQQAFEKLKQRLLAEGLFAQERKRPLPRYPQRVGVVTSRSGAAIRDVLQAVWRRHPGLELVLASCRVQGQGAGEEVACAIELLNEWSRSGRPERRIDIILVTRGGGSLEDLWAFNEEVVARAMFNSAIPIITGIGHEIDFTISDFVADFRAATPTAAAEVITEGFFASRAFVAEAGERLTQTARATLVGKADDLGLLARRLQRQHPRRWMQEQWQRLDDLQSSLSRAARNGHRMHHYAWHQIAQRLAFLRPSRLLERRRERLALLANGLARNGRSGLDQTQQRLHNATGKLRLLAPENVLERGYSITTDALSGSVIQSADTVQAGQLLRTRLKNGMVESIAKPHTGVDTPG
jgi:exodeoxyribonuclease VII large subunit